MKFIKKTAAIIVSLLMAMQLSIPVYSEPFTGEKDIDEATVLNEAEEKTVQEEIIPENETIPEQVTVPADDPSYKYAGYTYPEDTENITAEIYAEEETLKDMYAEASVSENGTEATTVDLYNSEVLYLSDLKDGGLVYSKIGYSNLKYNGNMNGSPISLYVDGKKTFFEKGFTAHAQSELVFKVDELVTKYGFKSFFSYLGVDSAAGGNGDGVKITVYTASEYDPKKPTETVWNTVKETGTLKGNSNCQEITLDIREKTNIKYIRFVFDQNSYNGSDHSVVAGICVRKAVYDRVFQNYDFIKTVADYDELLSEFGDNYAQLVNNEKYISLLQQRIIVENAGYNLLQDYANRSDEYKDAMEWFFGNNEALNLFINGGPPRGNNYLQAVKVMLDLYKTHREDVTNPLYLKMMIADALTNSERLGTWYGLDTTCDPVKRYEIYKHLHTNGYLVNNVFENLEVAEMRYVFEDTISDEEIEWLNFYHRKYKIGEMHPSIEKFNINNTVAGAYQYIRYGLGYNYDKAEYYSDENKESWIKKYHLENDPEDTDDDDFEFGNLYNNGKRLWIVFAEGSVCGGIAQTGAHLLTVNGMPAHHIGQPGHAAFIYMGYNSDPTNEKGDLRVWRLGNDVGGWTKSYTYNAYLPLNWGHQSWRNTYNISYIFLIQAALNNYKDYNEAEKYVRIADHMRVLKNYETAEEYYRKAIAIQKEDFNAWIGLYDNFKEKDATDDEFLALAKDASEKLTYYPTPMYDYMISAIRPEIDNSVKASEISSYLNEALLKATEANEDDTLQYKECRLLANFTLGNYDTGIADFSFDGEKPGTIVLKGQFADGGNQFLYSFDKGESWIEAGNDETTGNPRTEKKLTEEELGKITAENDLLVKLQGANSYHTIDILEGEVPDKYFLNDNENMIMGADSLCEYSDDSGASWHPITEAVEFLGNKSVYLRKKAVDIHLTSEPAIYDFTAETDDEKLSYINMKRVKVDSFSSENASRNEFAANTIDGDTGTMWHTNRGGGDNDKYIIYEFDKPVYLSAVDYWPGPEASGRFTACDVYTSTDKETWVLAGSRAMANNTEKKRIDLSVPNEAQYVKIVARDTNNDFASAGLIEFYEDLTAQGKTLMCIVMSEQPDKKEYLVGDTLDKTGMRVMAMYTDFSYGDVNLDSLNYSKTVFDEPGEETILITYPGFVNEEFPGADTLELNVTVKENTKKPIGISVEDIPDKTKYFVGDEFSTDGLTVAAEYEDNTKGYIFDYVVEKMQLDSAGTKNVNISWRDFTTDFEINVIKNVKSLSVSDNPDKMQYLVGEAFEPEGMEVIAEFDDDTSDVLDSDRYIVNSEGFSEFSGNRFINIVLGMRDNITTKLGVTVLPNVTSGYLKFDISENDYTCYVSGFEADAIPAEVVIPDKITVNGKDYTVTGVSSGAFDGAPINSVDFPSSMKDIQSGAFRNCYDIKEVYFIDHNSFNDLNVAADAFEYILDENNAEIYIADFEIMNDLLAKDGIKGKFVPGNFTDEIDDIEITLPEKRKYNIGDELDLNGFGVYVDISGNGQKTLVPPSFYDLTYSTDLCGTVTVTVRIKETDVTETFTINVDPAKPIIREMPVAGLYSEGEEIKPLVVDAYTTDKGKITYQWYKSETPDASPLRDTKLEGEVNSHFTPKETGYYYVAVTNSDGVNLGKGLTIHSNVVRIMVGGFVASIGSTGYSTLQDAIDAAKITATNTICITGDIVLDKPINFNHCSVVITSKGAQISEGESGGLPEITNKVYTIKRGPSMPANEPMFIQPSSTLGDVTFENIILDGGAVWSGNTVKDRENTGVSSNAPIIKTDGELCLGRGTELRNNSNSSFGGAVYTQNSADVTIDGAYIRDNYSGKRGGAVYAANGSKITLLAGKIEGNYAKDNGAAICAAQFSTVISDNCEFTGNVSDGNGVLWLENGKVSVNGGTITGNTCNYSAVHCINMGTIEINGGTVESPSAPGGNRDKTNSVYVAGSASLSIGYPERIDGPIYSENGKKLTFTGNTRGQEIYIQLGRGWNNVSDFADVTNSMFAVDDKNSIRISGKTAYLSEENDNLIRIKNTDLKYDADEDGYVTYLDAVRLLRKVAAIPESISDKDINKDGNVNILDVADIMNFLEY